MQNKQNISVIWFRNDLRIRDHKALNQAIESGLPILAVYAFDPRHYQKTRWGFKKTEKFRAKFLIETIENLQSNLEKLNISLITSVDTPENILQSISESYSITKIFYQTEWTSEEINVEKEVKKILPETEFNSAYDQFLFHPEDIPFQSYQEIPEVYTQFRKACEKKTAVRAELNTHKAIPETTLDISTSKIPQLEDLGFEDFEVDPRTAFPFKGGEDSAWDRVEDYFWNTKKLQVYKKTRNGLLGQDYSSKLSAWLANGSISAVSIYHQVKKFEKEITKNQDTYWLIFELIWRDYFKYISLKHGNSIFKLGGILQKDYEWHQTDKAFRQWTNGQTPEDFVNANMLEIKQTGFMSNRGRQNVNSYWAKEWKQDWRIGAAYFEAMLIDYDVHSNWGNWMYNSGVGNDPRDRKFNIKSQAQRYDANGKYQRTWLQNNLF